MSERCTAPGRGEDCGLKLKDYHARHSVLASSATPRRASHLEPNSSTFAVSVFTAAMVTLYRHRGRGQTGHCNNICIHCLATNKVCRKY